MSDERSPVRPFGRGDRTIIRPNPGARRPAAPAAPAASARSGAQVSSPPPPPAAPTEDWLSTPPAAASARRSRRAARRRRLRLRRAGRAEREPDHAGGGAAAAAARAPARRAAARLFASLMEQVAEAIKFFENDIRSAGIPEQQAQHREIHAVRHRRRHRPEHPDRGPARLDAVQHAEPLLRRAHRRRPLLRGAGPRQGDPLINYPLARAAARLPGARLPGHPPHLGRRQASTCSRSSATSTRRCGGCGRRSPTTCRRAGRARRSRPRRRGSRVPVWAVASVVGVLLLGLYVTLRTLLGGGADAVAAARR